MVTTRRSRPAGSPPPSSTNFEATRQESGGERGRSGASIGPAQSAFPRANDEIRDRQTGGRGGHGQSRFVRAALRGHDPDYGVKRKRGGAQEAAGDSSFSPGGLHPRYFALTS